MCVIMSKKVVSPKDNINSKEDKYCLFKLRDRGYDAKYSQKIYTFNNGISVLYLVDQKNNWTEGINSNGIMIISAALENHFDSLDDMPPAEYRKFIEEVNKRNGIILRRALRQTTIEKAKDLLVDTFFIGNTLISDGSKVYSIEIAVDPKKFDGEIDIDDNKNIDFHQFKMELIKNLDKKDFLISVKEINEDLYVKTNHSIEKRGLGYTPKDNGYESSKKRRDYIIKNLKDFDGGAIEIIELLDNMDSEELDKNPEMRPKRSKEKIDLSDKEKDKHKITDFYTTDIFGFKSDGTMIIRPIYSKIVNLDINNILKKTGINLIVIKGNNNESILLKAFNKIKNKGK